MRGDSGFIHTSRQQSVASLPEHQQDAAMAETELASLRYPSVPVGDCSLHVCRFGDDDWQVWLNTDDADFTGLCVSVGDTRDAAVAAAVTTLEATLEELQGPAPSEAELG